MENTGLRVGVALFGNIDTLAESHHQGVQKAFLLLFMVVFTEQWLDGLGGPFGIIEWDATEKVVDDVVIDNFMEKVTTNEAGCAVNGSQCALGVGPCLRSVVGNSGVGVLEVGDGDCESSLLAFNKSKKKEVTYSTSGEPRGTGSHKARRCFRLQ